MGSDMIVALKEASANGTTLFGLNHHAEPDARHSVQVNPGQMHDPGEMLHVGLIEIPQVRQTNSVLGLQRVGQWGFTHGINEHRVAIGVTGWHSRLASNGTSLTGDDLVRLALERSHKAHHAVEVLTDLLERYGQTPATAPRDSILLIADSDEAFVLETAGRYWALLECGHTRVVTDAAMIRQDWRRLAPGLATYVIEQGWWNDDGSKIDFVRCLAEKTPITSVASKRWGHASLALAQQQGAIDLYFLRRMLGDHFVQNRDFLPNAKTALASSFLVDLHAEDQPPIAWVAFGAPKVELYFPVCMQGQLPAGFGEGIPASPSIQERINNLQRLTLGNERAHLATTIERLQARFDQDAEEFLHKAQDYSNHGKPYLVGQFATEMMHLHVELFDKDYRRLLGMEEAPRPTVPEAEEVMYFA
ncbi:MAG: hypothetical protein FJ303_20635 [Planctomycetes bacterium]|nr:hypothetical protein [Planctomycetota bacterium]